VYDAFPAFLSELRNSLLLIEIVDRTIDGTIRKRLKDFWLTRNWDPQKFPLRLLVRFGKWLVRRFAKTELLADQVLRALLTGAGLSREKLAAKTLGYAAVAPERRTMLLAMGTDAAPSVLLYDREQDRLVADLELFRLSPGYTRQERLMTDIADALGGELRVSPAWAFLGKPITVHNQGGCRMSDTPELGVTTSDGKVWGCEGLYVLDGSVLCTSVGVNPSATITAIAERNVLQFIRAYTRNAEWPERDATDGAREYREQRIAAAARTHHALNEKWALTPPDKPGKPFKSPALGLRFRESMQGFYQPTSSAPTTEPGYRRCETEGRPGYPVELTLDVTTEDLATFFEDPTHELRIAGDIAIRLPHDERARTRRVTGRLELMVPPHKPYGISLTEPDRLRAQRFAGQDYSTRVGPPPENDERLMRYWVAFADEAGQNWLLRGYKRVRDDPGIDAWRDTASLFVQLLGPSNRPYPQRVAQDDSICGAGVVHADVTGFLFKQLRSIEVLGTEDPARIVWATAKFAAFFFGALQRIYLPEIQAALDALFARKATTVMIEPPALPDCPPPPEPPEPPSAPDALPQPTGVADQGAVQ
jgi:cholesterol oxidase